MKIYNMDMYGRGTQIFAPGKEHPEVSEWSERAFDLEGREYMKARQIVVKFEDGVAEVPDNLGAYMVTNGLAQSNRVTLLGTKAARYRDAELDRLRSENQALREQLRVARLQLQEQQRDFEAQLTAAAQEA